MKVEKLMGPRPLRPSPLWWIPLAMISITFDNMNYVAHTSFPKYHGKEALIRDRSYKVGIGPRVSSATATSNTACTSIVMYTIAQIASSCWRGYSLVCYRSLRSCVILFCEFLQSLPFGATLVYAAAVSRLCYLPSRTHE